MSEKRKKALEWLINNKDDFYTYYTGLEDHYETIKQALQEAWQPMETAPEDGTEIEVTYDLVDTCLAVWSDRPVCMLGSRNGGFPAGWATSGAGVDSNLPLDPPIAWREVQS